MSIITKENFVKLHLDLTDNVIESEADIKFQTKYAEDLWDMFDADQESRNNIFCNHLIEFCKLESSKYPHTIN